MRKFGSTRDAVQLEDGQVCLASDEGMLLVVLDADDIEHLRLHARATKVLDLFVTIRTPLMSAVEDLVEMHWGPGQDESLLDWAKRLEFAATRLREADASRRRYWRRHGSGQA